MVAEVVIRKVMAYLKFIVVSNNYIFLQIDLARSQLIFYAIDSASNKLQLIHKNLFTSGVGIFIVDKSYFQYNKITSCLDKFLSSNNLTVQ